MKAKTNEAKKYVKLVTNKSIHQNVGLRLG